MKFNETLRNDPENAFLQLRRIEAAKDIAKVIASSSQNTVYINSDNLMLTLLSGLGK
jgi:hypothetical protein